MMNPIEKIKSLAEYLPTQMKDTAYLRLWSISNVPMLTWCNPTVLNLSKESVVIRIPLSWRTKNHLGSMYFGVLACGADAAGGLVAIKSIEESGKNISLVFKDFKAEFLKRPEADTVFTCDDGDIIAEMIEETIKTGERVNRTVNVFANCPSVSDELVAKFQLTLSLKYQGK